MHADHFWGSSWWWTYDNWIYNYLCIQCQSSLKLWVQTTFIGEVYSIQHYVMKFVSDWRQVGGFLRVLQFPPRYNWNIVESCVKHRKPKPKRFWKTFIRYSHLRKQQLYILQQIILSNFHYGCVSWIWQVGSISLFFFNL